MGTAHAVQARSVGRADFQVFMGQEIMQKKRTLAVAVASEEEERALFAKLKAKFGE